MRTEPNKPTIGGISPMQTPKQTPTRLMQGTAQPATGFPTLEELLQADDWPPDFDWPDPPEDLEPPPDAFEYWPTDDEDDEHIIR